MYGLPCANSLQLHLLLTRKADVGTVDQMGTFPLFLASEFGHMDCVRLLVGELQRQGHWRHVQYVHRIHSQLLLCYGVYRGALLSRPQN